MEELYCVEMAGANSRLPDTGYTGWERESWHAVLSEGKLLS